MNGASTTVALARNGSAMVQTRSPSWTRSLLRVHVDEAADVRRKAGAADEAESEEGESAEE